MGGCVYVCVCIGLTTVGRGDLGTLYDYFFYALGFPGLAGWGKYVVGCCAVFHVWYLACRRIITEDGIHT